ncbi:uncharacterized protein LOC115666419 isoform X4 [Syzygium oleosum]|uniref:uncharacterized protein LOC115666419 isoform X4 n=1 Tax=Syzygium oleosum TaxID=219896 RepID=UPI0024BB320C|nr:uncharacterized protein LOC115666419 isoform X4 [Syzygium oleosum]
MEEAIATLGRSLGHFCNHLQSSVDALNQSIDRRPIPLDSASSTFVQCLNRRVSTASGDLELLDSMSFGTVSFEELLGHCNEVFKKNQSDLAQLEERLKSFGYVPANGKTVEPNLCSRQPQKYDGPCLSFSFFVGLLFSFSIFAFSSLRHEPPLLLIFLLVPIRNQEDKMYDLEGPYQPATLNLGASEVEGPKSVVNASKDEYESLPSYMKSLASWEDLLIAIEKINSYLSKKENRLENKSFFQDEISSLALGPKARSYLLLLARMKHLVVETVDGLISYRVL